MTSADDLAHHLATFFSEHLPGRIGASRHTILAYRDAWKLGSASRRNVWDGPFRTSASPTSTSTRRSRFSMRSKPIGTTQWSAQSSPYRAPGLLPVSRIGRPGIPRALSTHPRDSPQARPPAHRGLFGARGDGNAARARRPSHASRSTRLRAARVSLQLRSARAGGRRSPSVRAPTRSPVSSPARRQRPQGTDLPVVAGHDGVAAGARGRTRHWARHGGPGLRQRAWTAPHAVWGPPHRESLRGRRHACPAVPRPEACAPHTFRHACAVHLLQAGVELNLIRSWLGHVSLETTQRYAEIDLAQKRRALDGVTPIGTPGRRQAATWRRESILAWLERL